MTITYSFAAKSARFLNPRTVCANASLSTFPPSSFLVVQAGSAIADNCLVSTAGAWKNKNVTLYIALSQYSDQKFKVGLDFKNNCIFKAGLPISETRTKNFNLPENQKGYDNSETTDEKLSARRIRIFRVPFSVIIFQPPILKLVDTSVLEKRRKKTKNH